MSFNIDTGMTDLGGGEVSLKRCIQRSPQTIIYWTHFEKVDSHSGRQLNPFLQTK